jgi:small conductance mechanosensitive channel
MALVIVAAESFSERYGNEITAVLTLVGAFVLVFVVNRALRGRVSRMSETLRAGELSPVTDTRLRFLRRAVDAAIVITGIALAVAQFTSLDRLAATVLASSAIAAAVVGFASRQVLANAIAGMVLAVTQPLRIGDLVSFDGETGTVEDVSLTYTWLRTGSDARIIIPNERLASGTLRNDSIRSSTVALEVSVWLAPEADEAAALEAVRRVGEVSGARVAEVTDTGIRVQVAGPPVPPSERLAREAALREATLRALREAGCRGSGDEP